MCDSQGCKDIPLATTIAKIVIEIVKDCVEYDMPFDDDAGYEGQPPKTAFYELVSVDRRTWATISSVVKKNISNILLVYKDLRDAAFESFGTILGDRRFRITNIGLADLEDIGSNQALAPWIKTLTFGTAQLESPYNPSIRQQMHTFLHKHRTGPTCGPSRFEEIEEILDAQYDAHENRVL